MEIQIDYKYETKYTLTRSHKYQSNDADFYGHQISFNMKKQQNSHLFISCTGSKYHLAAYLQFTEICSAINRVARLDFLPSSQ